MWINNSFFRIAGILFFQLLLLSPLLVQAEQAKDFGKYVVHYNAFTADNLSSSVASQYNIQRSKTRVLLNIAVLKKIATDSSANTPVNAVVKGTATNLSQQLRNLSFRRISDKGAIYYIADHSVNNAENLKYKIEILPEGEKAAYALSFKQQFYTE